MKKTRLLFLGWLASSTMSKFATFKCVFFFFVKVVVVVVAVLTQAAPAVSRTRASCWGLFLVVVTGEIVVVAVAINKRVVFVRVVVLTCERDRRRGSTIQCGAYAADLFSRGKKERLVSGGGGGLFLSPRTTN